MIYSSSLFLYIFLPLFLISYFSFKNIGSKNYVIITFSTFFYLFGDFLFFSIILISMFFEYYLIFRYKKNYISNRFKTIFFVLINLSLLLYFKYFNFFQNLINDLFYINQVSESIYLPLGISFIIFQKISFLLDTFDKKVSKPKNFMHYYMYIFYFPQIIAGPIVRFKEISAQFHKRTHNKKKFYFGFSLIVIGLFKKIVIADSLSILTESVFNSNQVLPFYYYMIGNLSFTFQLYFDFSGYSDIAIGIGSCCGINIPKNFNYPYKATSISDFWNRWHMSLSRWMKDYLYIRLGGNRLGNLRTSINLWIVFLLSGLWHGASYNFILWGFFHGFFLSIEKIFRMPKLGKFLTFFIIFNSWVIFKIEDFNNLMAFYSSMYNFVNFTDTHNILLFFNPLRLLLLLFILYLVLFDRKINFDLFYSYKNESVFSEKKLLFLIVFCLIICVTKFNNTLSPFLYFRF